MSLIEENIRRLRERIGEAAARSGKDSDSVQLVAAAKEVEPERIKEALANGVRIIGENKVQEALRKHSVIGNQAEWHMIGHLQTNKVKKALEVFSLVQSLDSLRLAEEMSKRASSMGREMDVLVEVNTSGEESKYGVNPEDTIELVTKVSKLEGIRVRGLFTIGIFSPNPEDSRPCFRALRELKEKIEELELDGVSMEYLSMGMTNDFEVAIEEGSNMVRIGMGIFGPRSGH